MKSNLAQVFDIGFLRAKFDFEHMAKHFDIDLFCYSGSTISHYTDLNGLFGIVESGGFWLSDHRFLNDSEEFENGRNITRKILDKLATKKRHYAFSEILKKSSCFLGSHKEKACFVCSFSKDPDNLDQWRAYAGGDQGISITFDNTRKSLSHFFIMPIMTVSKVIYDDKEKTKIIIRILKKYEDEYKTDKRLDNHIDIDDWAEEMSKQLTLNFLNFKHHAYESEKEVRVIVASSQLKYFKGQKLKHRVGKDRIIPYISSSDLYDDQFYKHFENKLLPIKEVRVGPTVNQEMTILSIEEYLMEKGYNQTKVIKSILPYRG
jgi:hypothetical protein